MRRGAWLLLLSLPAAACGEGGLAGAPWSAPPALDLVLEAQLSAESVPVMGAFTLRLDLFVRGGEPVEFAPAIPAGCAGTVAQQPPRALYDGQWQRWQMDLRAVAAPGALVIPPFVARRPDGRATASTPELSLQVTSRLRPDGAEGTPAAGGPATGGASTADAATGAPAEAAQAGGDPASDPAAVEAPGPLFEPPVRWWSWAAAATALAAALAALLWWLRLRPPQRRMTDEVRLPPHVTALRELARLRAAPRRSAAEVDAFYVAVSQVVRVYLEQRFGLRAPERTTEEFLQEVEAGGPLSAGQCLGLRRILQQCDLVKFAAWMPAEQVHLQTLAAAEELVQATRADTTRTAEVRGEVA